jgi:hypothetical protein
MHVLEFAELKQPHHCPSVGDTTGFKNVKDRRGSFGEVIMYDTAECQLPNLENLSLLFRFTFRSRVDLPRL